MDTLVRARGKLFERPEQPREFRLTDRDLSLLNNIGRLRLATAAQLTALDGGSEQNVSRALLVLWEHGYVDRLVGQVENRLLYKGSFPIVYGLTRQGAWLLRKYGYEVRRRLLYEIDKQREAGWRFIEHRVDITEFIIRLEMSAKGRTDVGVLARGDLLVNAPKTQRDRRVRLSAKIGIDGTLRQFCVDPDEIFGLHFFETEEESYFMFERDRGHMPVRRRKSKDQTYYAKKMEIYYEANRSGAHIRDLGIPNFRVATITTTTERVWEMINAQKEFTNGHGSNMFLFTHDAALAANNPLELEWITGRGERLKLTH